MDKNIIFNRLKQIKGMESDAQLADFLGVTAATLSNWRRRNSLDYDVLLSKCEDVDLNYLLFGEQKAYSTNQSDTTIEIIINRYEKLLARNAIIEYEFKRTAPKEYCALNECAIQLGINVEN